MTVLQLIISSTGCAGQLALALVALKRASQSRLAVPLVLLFLDVFVWNMASLLEAMSGPPVWGWLDHTTSPLTAPLAVEFVLTFVGRWRRSSRLRVAIWIPFLCLSLVPTVGLFVPLLHDWDREGPWAIALAVVAIPTMTFAIALLVVHLRSSADLFERSRTRLLLVGAVLGTTLGLVDLASNLVHEIPSNLGALGFLAAFILTMFAVTRVRLLESDLTRESVITALSLSAAGVIAYLALFSLAGSSTLLLVMGVALLTLALVAVIRRLAHRSGLERARIRELATLGRFAAQMAHDFKNPLAALKGATELLQHDLSAATSKSHGKYLELMLQQIQRIEGSIAAYQRLARVEPLLATVQINDVVRDAVSLQEFAGGKRIALSTDLRAQLPPVRADRGLLDNALQNVLRNASEAIEGAGTVAVRTGLSSASVRPLLFVRIEDTGRGMDARTREQAVDEFFTTKPQGSGLGLSFVRRVMEAHGGSLAIDSQEGRGTVIWLRLPVE